MKHIKALIISICAVVFAASFATPSAAQAMDSPVYEGNTFDEVVHGEAWTELPYESRPLTDDLTTRLLAATDTRAAYRCRVIEPTVFELCGVFLDKYDSAGPIKWFGRPTSGMIRNPDGVGMRVHFEHASLYWHPNVGIAFVLPPAMEAWGRSGFEAGPLGYPVADAFAVGPNPGVKQLFANGTMYGSVHGVHVVRGRILESYNSHGAEQGKLGFPLSDELGVPDTVGRFNRFQGGMIYWTPRTDAHPILGGILETWSRQGYERSRYGYPTADPVDTGALQLRQSFEHGQLVGVDNWLAPYIYDPTFDVPEDELGKERAVRYGFGDRSAVDPDKIVCGGLFGSPHQSYDALKNGRHEIHSQGRNFCDPYPDSVVVLSGLMVKRKKWIGFDELPNIGKTPLPKQMVGATRKKPNKAVLVSTCEPGEYADYRAYWGSSATINGKPVFILQPLVVTGQNDVYCAPDVGEYRGAIN